MTIDTYRALLESCLCDKIVALDRECKELSTGSSSAEVVSLLRFEVNGLCIALRLLGDYGETAFDLAWATRDVRAKEDWESALNLSYARPIKRY